MPQAVVEEQVTFASGAIRLGGRSLLSAGGGPRAGRAAVLSPSALCRAT